eukprot:3181910-Rhodomonas_salina.1
MVTDNLVFVPGDLRESGALAKVLKRATQNGEKLTLWVNNAGIAMCPFEVDTLVNGETVQNWRALVDINFCAMIEGTQVNHDTWRDREIGRERARERAR